jgi:trimethylamine--corrinoid protein Co-methyltransferase
VKADADLSTVAGAGLRLDVLSDDAVRLIHEGTLEVLEHTGVFVEDDEALDIFGDGGCAVERERRVVRFPPEVVEEALASCPQRILCAGRDPKNDIWEEAGGEVHFANFDEGIKYIDPRTGEYRDPTKDDVAEVARLIDALPSIAVFDPAIGPKDVPGETASIHGFEAALHNTTKHTGCEAVSGREARACIEMAAAVVGGYDELRERPILGLGVCPVSPLQLTRDATEVIIETARAGLSDTILSMAMSGGSAPVTLAGTLVQHNAEVLSGITLAQLTERGAPCVYGSSTTALDLRYAAAAVGSPELALISACAAQLARQYRLPSFIAGA